MKLVIYRMDGIYWFDEVIEDEGFNVFYKVMFWCDGILIIVVG